MGSELSKKHSILVIEKNKVGSTSKTWTAEKKIIDKAGLSRFITAKFERCYLKSFNDNKFFIKDKIASVDETKILLHFKK